MSLGQQHAAELYASNSKLTPCKQEQQHQHVNGEHRGVLFLKHLQEDTNGSCKPVSGQGR